MVSSKIYYWTPLKNCQNDSQRIVEIYDYDYFSYLLSILLVYFVTNDHWLLSACSVEVFTNPREALDFLNDHAQDIDFLLVAVEMEEIPGFEFLERATEMYENIQVISKCLHSY